MAVNKKWAFNPDRQLGEIIRNCVFGSHWWTNALDPIEIQLTEKAVKDLFPSFLSAYQVEKPFTFLIIGNPRSKLRLIESTHGKDFYISAYGDEIFTRYDHNKINHLSTNSVSLYYPFENLPQSLISFANGRAD